MPTAAIIVVALVITAVVGLIAGAVWGQAGHGTPDSSPTTASPTSSSASPSDTATPTDTGSATSTPTGTTTPTTSPSGSGSPTNSPGPTPTGSAPPAPATTTTVADGWRLGPWRITQTGGNLGVDTTCRNTATGTRSANLVLYVYVNNQLIATTTATVTNVASGATVPVHFSSTDAWKPGTKVLLLQTA